MGFLTEAFGLDGPIQISDQLQSLDGLKERNMSATPYPGELRQLLDQADLNNQQRKAQLDELNRAILKFETALNSREFGIPGSVVIDDDDEDEPGYEQHLTYRRVGKGWGLLVEEYVWDERKSSAHLATCSEEIRRRAVGGFVALLTKIIAEIEAGDRKLKEEVAHVESLVSVVQRGES